MLMRCEGYLAKQEEIRGKGDHQANSDIKGSNHEALGFGEKHRVLFLCGNLFLHSDRPSTVRISDRNASLDPALKGGVKGSSQKNR